MILQDVNNLPAVDDRETIPYQASVAGPREVRERKLLSAFFLGMAVVAASLFYGRSYLFFLFFLAFSFIMSLIWRNAPRSWIFLASISGATPASLSRYQFSGNLVFAFWYLISNPKCLFRLPAWIYLPSILAVFGLFTSSINWMSGDIVHGFMKQVTFAYNLFLAPFLFLPAVYLRMRESRDNVANLQGLLFCLIVPSTLILVSARMFGTVTNAWEASQHVGSIAEGFLMYRLGRVTVNFSRTEVGFILAALICASTAVTVSQVKSMYRMVAGACMAANAFLLLVTGSFGSILGCLCGLAAIFFIQFRTVSLTKVLVSVTSICCMLALTFVLLPSTTKQYLAKRYEHRVVNADTDRLYLWGRAVEQLFHHPEGIGFTYAVGDVKKTNIHNEYLTYAVSYGIIGGLGYFLLVAGLLISFFRVPGSAIHDPYVQAVYLAGLGVLVAVSLNSITDHMNENRWYFNIIWSVIWYSYSCSRTDGDGNLPQDSIAHATGDSTTIKSIYD